MTLERYSYVSLFGINSLEGLKLATFENLEFLTSDVADDPSKDAIDSRWSQLKRKVKHSVSGRIKGAMPLASVLPSVAAALEKAGPLFFSMVRNQIVCIDDLERRSAGITVAEVLGLTSYLKDQRSCKIALLLNVDALNPADKKDFLDNQEKVVDVFLTFAPGPVAAVQIALLRDDVVSGAISEKCLALKISNIRVIKKIERLVRMIQPLVSKFDEKIFFQAIHSLTLLGWAKYQPNQAPTLEYLKSKRGRDYFGLEKAEEITEEEVSWKVLLDAYGFGAVDDFDLALLDGVENGFFIPELIETCATRLNNAFKNQAGENSYRDAWNMYHGSFDCNHNEALDEIFISFMGNIQIISPLNLNGTVRLFKNLGRQAQASEILNAYVAQREGDSLFWDLSEHLFPGDEVDPDLRAAFKDKLESLLPEFDAIEVLKHISEHHGWNTRDIDRLATLSSADFYTMFKTLRDSDLKAVIKSAFSFGQIVNGTTQMGKISKEARAALVQIGKECPINAMRIRKYGIESDEIGEAAIGSKAPDPAIK